MQLSQQKRHASTSRACQHCKLSADGNNNNFSRAVSLSYSLAAHAVNILDRRLHRRAKSDAIPYFTTTTPSTWKFSHSMPRNAAFSPVLLRLSPVSWKLHNNLLLSLSQAGENAAKCCCFVQGEQRYPIFPSNRATPLFAQQL